MARLPLAGRLLLHGKMNLVSINKLCKHLYGVFLPTAHLQKPLVSNFHLYRPV